jgi:glucuronate isomerase
VKSEETRQQLQADERFHTLMARLEELVGTLSPRWLSMVMAAMNRMRCTPTKAFLDKLRDAISKRLAEDSFEPRSLSHIINTFVAFGYQPGRHFMDAFVEVSHGAGART